MLNAAPRYAADRDKRLGRRQAPYRRQRPDAESAQARGRCGHAILAARRAKRLRATARSGPGALRVRRRSDARKVASSTSQRSRARDRSCRPAATAGYTRGSAMRMRRSIPSRRTVTVGGSDRIYEPSKDEPQIDEFRRTGASDSVNFRAVVIISGASLRGRRSRSPSVMPHRRRRDFLQCNSRGHAR